MDQRVKTAETQIKTMDVEVPIHVGSQERV
jgi:hypothetical protein